jgi:hypothetical protein
MRHDADDGNASDVSLPGSPDGRAQITRFSVALDGHFGHRAAAHNGGNARALAPAITQRTVIGAGSPLNLQLKVAPRIRH